MGIKHNFKLDPLFIQFHAQFTRLAFKPLSEHLLNFGALTTNVFPTQCFHPQGDSGHKTVPNETLPPQNDS